MGIRRISEAVDGAMFGPESHSATRYEVNCRVEAAEVDRLRAENASLRHALTVVRAELETALRHLRGC
jgi:hypothetical protein